MRRPASVALACVAVLIGASPLASERTPPFSLGVVRADGVLIPFTHFDGWRWNTSWPFPPSRVDVPLGLRDVPSKWWPDRTPELAWNVWTGDGDVRRVEVTAPFWTPVLCDGVVGLRTTYTPAGPVPPPLVQPYPKIGLATTGDVVVEPITVVPRDSEDWVRLEVQVATRFTAAENEALKSGWRDWWRQGPGRWTHPVPEAQRATGPITLEAVYRAPYVEPGSMLYFFEATRRYERRGTDETPACDLVTFAWGWMMVEASGEISLDLSAAITDCERWGINVMFPLGLLRLDGRVVWAAQWSGWDEELYLVAEVPPDLDVKRFVEVRAGDCW